MEGEEKIEIYDGENEGGNEEVISIEEKKSKKKDIYLKDEEVPLINPLTEHRTIHIDRDPVFLHISDLHIRSPRFFRNDKRWYATRNLFRYFTETYCDKEVFVIITGNVTNSPLININLFVSAARQGIKYTLNLNDPKIIRGGIQLSHFHIFSSAGNHDCYGFGYINISKRLKGKFEGYTRQDLIDPVWIEINHTRYDNILKKRKYHLVSLDTTEEQSDPFTSMGKLGNRQLEVFRQVLETIRMEDPEEEEESETKHRHNPKEDKIFVFLHHNPFTELIELSLRLRHRMQRIIDEVQEGGFFNFKQDMMLLEDGDDFLDILDFPNPEDRIDVLLFGHCHLYMDLFENKKFEKGEYEPLNDEQGTEEEELHREHQEAFRRIAKFKIVGETNTAGGHYKDVETGKWVSSYSEYSMKFGKKLKKKKKKKEEEEHEGEEDEEDEDEEEEEDDDNHGEGGDRLVYKHIVGVPILSQAEYALGTFGCCNIL